jgi:hypothetical protein
MALNVGGLGVFRLWLVACGAYSYFETHARDLLSQNL